MKARVSLICVFLFCTVLVLTANHDRYHSAQARETAVSEAEALQALAYGRLLANEHEANTELTPTISTDSYLLQPHNNDSADDLSGDIAFSSNRSGIYNLYTRNAAGGSDNLLVGSTGHDATPSWSPTMTQLVFASDRDGDFDIYLKTALGQEINLTNNTTQDINPSWSPDGQRILFSSNRGGGYYQVYTMNVTGQDVKRIGTIANNALWPRFSPDGSRIAFMRASIAIPACDWNWDIWIMDANTGLNQQRITTQFGGDIYPNWTPDDRIIYASCRNFIDSDLFIVHPDNGAEVRLTNWFGSNEWHGIYSPDADYIAFNTTVEGNSEVYVAPAAGGATTNFTQHSAEDLVPSWGISTVGSCLGATARQPILMVTGWGGSEGKTGLNQDGQLKYFTDHLHNHGYVEGCNLFYAKHTSPYRFLYLDLPFITGKSNATIIHDELCEYAEDAAQWNPGWTGHFDIIAHSYGGLRARAFLERKDLYGRDINSGHYGTICANTSHRLVVDNLYTMGTPHGGELPMLPFSVLIGLTALIGDAPNFDPELPAFIEMLPDIRFLQNLLSSQPDGVNYYLIAGDTRSQVAAEPTLLFYALAFWPFDTVRLDANDFAVHESSAHALTTLSPLYPNVYTTTTPDIHGQVPSWVDPLHRLRSYVNPGTTFEAKICPYIPLSLCANSDTLQSSFMSQSSASNTSVMQMVANQSQPQSQPPAPVQDIRAGALSGNETVTGRFEMNGSGRSTVMAAWTNGSIDLSLADPNGNLINSQTTANDANIDYFLFDGGIGITASYQMTTTLSGTWTYTITANSLTDPAGYRLLAVPPVPIGVGGSSPGWVPNSSPVVITATVAYEANTPVNGGNVTASIRRPDDNIETISLFDDGNHQDGSANDGVFGATYNQTTASGLYGIFFKATGQYAGDVYERTAVAYFTVAPNSVSLSGSYQDSGISNNSLGLYEFLDVSTNLNVTNAGTYALSAELYAGNTFITHAVTRAVLSPGTHTFSLLFDGVDIRSTAQDGPYIVRNVLLLDESDVTVLAEADDFVYTTNAYAYSQFGIPAKVLLPIIIHD